MSSNLQSLDVEAPVIVVGAGPVGLHFVKTFASLNPSTTIDVFSAEAFHPYDRVKLSSLLAQDIEIDEVYNPIPQSDCIRFFEHCPIISIDKDQKRVMDDKGVWHPYSKLVLALGSSPFIPNIPGPELQNVFTFRDLKDTEALLARNIGSRHTIVIGGGLLGVETARAMLRNSTRVSIIQLGRHLMNQQLDDGAGLLLQSKVEQLGIEVICSARVSSIHSDGARFNGRREKVTGISLSDGREIACDTVVISAGIRPNTRLALEHGISIDKGIRVNEVLETSVSDIFAIGECSQYQDQIYGLVAPGIEQASVLAHHLSGREARYQGTINSTSLKVIGENVFSVGSVNTEEDPSLEVCCFDDSVNGVYRAIFTKHKRLKGALCIGEWPDQHRLRAGIQENQRLPLFGLKRFRNSGSLWAEEEQDRIQNWPSDTVICNCTGVTQGELLNAHRKGAGSVESLSESTGASLVCGSCKPLLAQFVGSPAGIAQVAGLTAMKWLCAAALLLLMIMAVLSPIPYADSVQSLPIDQLWLNALSKQVSGFTLLGLSAFSLLMSLSKRWQKFKLGQFTSWRLVHLSLGTIAVIALLLHTGINLGNNLNRWLMLDFLILLALGVTAGMIIVFEARLSARLAKSMRSYFTWAHTLVFWPLPTLLAFHIISVYYF